MCQFTIDLRKKTLPVLKLNFVGLIVQYKNWEQFWSLRQSKFWYDTFDHQVTYCVNMILLEKVLNITYVFLIVPSFQMTYCLFHCYNSLFTESIDSCKMFLLFCGNHHNMYIISFDGTYYVVTKHARILLYWEREYLHANWLLIQFLISYSYNITESWIHTKTEN